MDYYIQSLENMPGDTLSILSDYFHLKNTEEMVVNPAALSRIATPNGEVLNLQSGRIKFRTGRTRKRITGRMSLTGFWNSREKVKSMIKQIISNIIQEVI